MSSTPTATIPSSRSQLRDDYIDPAFRERRPRFVIDDNGKERLSVEGKLLGNPRGICSLGSVGVRQGDVALDSLNMRTGAKAGSIDTPASRYGQ